MLPTLQSRPLLAALVALLWIALVLYGFSACWWLFETLVLARGRERFDDPDDFRWSLDDVQVRVLTVDAEAVVQGTVDALPDAVTDVHVIAERDIDVDGAAVHAVPEAFDCEATNKGRALEWARRNVPCDREYVLYLDEDTLVAGLTGMPDADVVQFTEKPLFTGSRLTYLCELFRIGYQFEQLGFHRLRYPLYAWGGGVAIRHDLEDAISWDVQTITEDTNFVWRAARERSISYRLVDARFRNQAPPSLWAMLKQRRRWISGTMRDGASLPLRYRPLAFTRVVAWGFSPFVPVLVVGAYAFPGSAPTLDLYAAISTALLGILFVYTLAGLLAYRKHPLLWPIFLLLTPLAVVLHALGAMWGLVRPVETFEVTEKVPPAAVERANASLDEGSIASHDGTERLARESADDFEWAPFDD